MSKLKIADDLSLPIEAVTETICILGIRGSGKTHTATVMVEEMLRARQPVCVYDPTGAWFGLKTSADGKSAGFPVVVFGGEHADVPLEETAGETIARVIVEKRMPAVLDCSLMRKGARVRFMTDFCETLYHKNREPLHFVADEAHTLAPQKPFPDAAKLLGAIEDMVLQGRRRGLGMTVISQRPALLNTNVRTQCSTLIAMRILGPHDLKAVREWTDAHGTPDQAEQLLESLPTLKTGEGWVWSPAWLDSFQKVQFRHRKTFDSSATPKVGQKAMAPEVVAEIDLAALGEQIKATVEKAKADDPKELRKQIAEWKRKWESAEQTFKQNLKQPPPVQVEKIIEVPVLKNGQLERTEKVIERTEALAGKLLAESAELRRLIAPATARPIPAPRAMPQHAAAGQNPPQARTPKPAKNIQGSMHGAATAAAEASSAPSGGLRRMMTALAQRPQGLSDAQLGVRAQLSSDSGTFGTYLGQGRKAGWIEGERKLLQITDAGLQVLGDYEPLPTGRALLSYWVEDLGGGAARMLSALADAYPQTMTDAEIGQAAGISHESGTFGTYLGTLRRLELVNGTRQALKASDELFE